MRKILAGFMATSMIVAVASSVTFAAAPTAVIRNAALSGAITPADDYVQGTGDNFAPIATGWNNPGTLSYTYTNTVTPILDFLDANGNLLGSATLSTINLEANGTIDVRNDSNGIAGNSVYTRNQSGNMDVSANLNGMGFENLTLDGQGENVGKLYSGSLVRLANGDVRIQLSENAQVVGLTDIQLRFTESPAISPATITYKTGAAQTDTTIRYTAPRLGLGGTSSVANNTNPSYTAVDTAGALTNLAVNDVVVCDQDGNPMVLTEKKTSVDEDQNTEGGVQSGKTLYFMIRNDGVVPRLDDDTYWKLKITKGDNGKHIKAINDVSKIFSKGLYPLGSGTVYAPTVGNRCRYIKVELNEIYTDDEFKMTLDMRLSAKTKAIDAKLRLNDTAGTLVTDDSEIKVKDFYFYMKNLVKPADNDWRVGIDGLMLNPVENDWNDVTYFDEDGDVAHMKFFADSDVGKFYSKLSTKWEHADYASYFNDQDAFIFNFTGSPKLSSTSRADLEIYNPFVDEDGNETIDPSTAVVYQVIDGDLYDVTDSFEYKEGDNGDMAFCTRTRFLGTYIICEKAVEEAVADETVPDELTPDTTEAPEDVTPDNNAGGKQPANTGKYL